jgi:hypothetical protein
LEDLFQLSQSGVEFVLVLLDHRFQKERLWIDSAVQAGEQFVRIPNESRVRSPLRDLKIFACEKNGPIFR